MVIPFSITISVLIWLIQIICSRRIYIIIWLMRIPDTIPTIHKLIRNRNNTIIIVVLDGIIPTIILTIIIIIRIFKQNLIHPITIVVFYDGFRYIPLSIIITISIYSKNKGIITKLFFYKLEGIGETNLII